MSGPAAAPAGEERRAARWLVAPALVALAVVAAYPLVAVIWLSLRRRMLVFGIDEWRGLDNFALLARDARFWNALWNTVYFAAVSVTAELALGLGMAMALRRAFPGRALVRAAILVPWAIPGAVAAKMWQWLFMPGSGLIDYVLARPDLDWLGSPTLALHAAIAADVWKTTPFVALLVLAGLETIPEDLYRAARVDGAGALRTFFEVTLPLLRPALAVAAIFRTLDALRVFDAVFVLTGGGPANTTETLSIYAYKVLFQTLQFGYGSALAVVTFALVLVASAILVRVLAWHGPAA
ncbi:MAG TPA: sugar ABC transporter permease [Planctomycetota bacterium]|nr:sugar ABC transporter permease [Planctomycetota bacterium]